MAKHTCGTCALVKDCRPYGVDGGWICLACMTSLSRREQLAQFEEALARSEAKRRPGEVVAMTDDGPFVIKVPDGPGRN